MAEAQARAPPEVPESITSKEATIGELRVAIPDPCVCGDDFLFAGWHAPGPIDADVKAVVGGALAGQTHCAHCGTKWRIFPADDESWDEFPILKMDEAYRGPTKEFYLETGLNKRNNQRKFESWLRENYPNLV